jgi:hypothetical protein
VRDQVSHPYKTTGRIMVLYILTFTLTTEKVYSNIFASSNKCSVNGYKDVEINGRSTNDGNNNIRSGG